MEISVDSNFFFQHHHRKISKHWKKHVFFPPIAEKDVSRTERREPVAEGILALSGKLKNERNVEESEEEKNLVFKRRFIPSRNFPSSDTLFVSWQLLTSNVSVSSASTSFLKANSTHATFEEAKPTLVAISKKIKEKNKIICMLQSLFPLIWGERAQNPSWTHWQADNRPVQSYPLNPDETGGSSPQKVLFARVKKRLIWLFCFVLFLSFLVFQQSQWSEEVSHKHLQSSRGRVLQGEQEDFRWLGPNLWRAHVKHELRTVGAETSHTEAEAEKRGLAPSLTVDVKPFLIRPLGAIAHYDCGQSWYDLDFCRVMSVWQLWECLSGSGEFERETTPSPLLLTEWLLVLHLRIASRRSSMHRCQQTEPGTTPCAFTF